MNTQDGPSGPVGVMGRMVLLDPQEQGTGSAPPAPAPAPPATPPPATPPAPPAPVQDGGLHDEKAMGRVFDDNTPVEYIDDQGETINTTLGDLIKRHSATRNIDPEQIRTISGALNNDPEANRRLLEQQLQRLQASNPEPQSEEGKRLAQLEDKLRGMETQFQHAKRVTDAYEIQEISASVRHLLATNPEVQKALPYLSAKPEAALAEVTSQIKQLRDTSRMSGQGGHISGEQISQVLSRANQRVERIAGLFGGSLSPNQPQAGQVVTAMNTPQSQAPHVIPGQPGVHGDVRPPAMTPQDILRLAAQPPNPNPNAPIQPQYSGLPNTVPASVPQPGGQVAGAAPASVPNAGGQQGQKFSRDQMVAALAARRNAEEAQQ